MLNLRAVNLKTLWVLLWLAFFVTYVLSLSGSGVENYFEEYQYWMGVGMFVLSFPASFCLLLIAGFLIDILKLCSYSCDLYMEAIFCLGVFAVGYFQCVAISRIFNGKLSLTTTLNLNGTANIASTATPPVMIAANAATPVPVVATRVLEASLNR